MKLRACGRKAEHAGLLREPAFLAVYVQWHRPDGLLAEYEWAEAQEGIEEAQARELRELGRALSRHAHVVAEAPTQLLPCLHNQMDWTAQGFGDLQQRIDQALERHGPDIWLRRLNWPQGHRPSPLLGTLTGHTEGAARSSFRRMENGWEYNGKAGGGWRTSRRLV